MKEKNFKNSKNKIGLKNFLVTKNETNFMPQRINIKTINLKKNFNYFNEDKNFFVEKNINNIKYYDSTQNYNIVTKNDYFHKKNKRNSIINSSDSERIPSPISLMNTSTYIPSGKKKYKKRRNQKKKNRNKRSIRYNNISNSSIQNLSFNTNSNSNTKKNLSYINIYSSSSEKEEEYEYSDSSDTSYKSRENRRKKYLDKMLVEENELDYLKKSEVGLDSAEDDDNNSIDNNNSIEENFNNEIERILIEIYNKNISLISSGNIYEINKNNGDVQDIEKQIKKYLKRENFKTNLLVLKSLSNKIKELIGKYKEKVFEIEEIKAIKLAFIQRQILNEQIIRCNNSLESNVATNYNSNESYNSYLEEDNLLKNGILLNTQDEINKKGVTHILLRELINIKRTLKVSSKEIEGIFKYPLNILKNDEGKKIKFSIELMQREEFCKTLLEDDLISNLLNQIKEIFFRFKNQKVTKWLLELDESYQHKNEMTRFVKYINDRLPQKQNCNKNNENTYLEELKSDEEKEVDNDNNINNLNNPEEKKNKKKRNKKENEKIMNMLEENNNEQSEMQFKDIDEILNYINDDTDSKKGKKKGKKGKKNKNKKEMKEEKENQVISNGNNEVRDLMDGFEKEFENFKNEIEKDTIFVYEINSKIKPCLSDNFLNSISIM